MGEYISSPEAFDEFMRSSVWADMKNELARWLNDVHEALELGHITRLTKDGVEVAELSDKELHRLQGNAEAFRKFERMPEVIRDNIIDDREGE